MWKFDKRCKIYKCSKKTKISNKHWNWERKGRRWHLGKTEEMRIKSTKRDWEKSGRDDKGMAEYELVISGGIDL